MGLGCFEHLRRTCKSRRLLEVQRLCIFLGLGISPLRVGNDNRFLSLAFQRLPMGFTINHYYLYRVLDGSEVQASPNQSLSSQGM